MGGGEHVAGMFPFVDQMIQVGAPPHLSPLPTSPPFPVMVAIPWHPMLLVHLGLVLTQNPTSQPVSATPQVPTCQSLQTISQPTKVTPQVSQHVQVVSQIRPS